jgi:hypothetical protein
MFSAKSVAVIWPRTQLPNLNNCATGSSWFRFALRGIGKAWHHRRQALNISRDLKRVVQIHVSPQVRIAKSGTVRNLTE